MYITKGGGKKCNFWMGDFYFIIIFPKVLRTLVQVGTEFIYLVLSNRN
jgi:hypothetical protein